MSLPKQTHEQISPVSCQIEEATAMLQKLALFRDTPLDILKIYAYLTSKEEFESGEYIVEQGNANDKMYIILQGHVSIHEQYGEKSYKLQELSHEGFNYFGELALLGKFDWFFSAKAESDVILLSLTREAFRKIMERNPEIYTSTVEKIVSWRIARYVDQTKRLLETINSQPLEDC